MQISYNGVKLLKELEGFRNEAYLDTGGVPTIGYGSTKVNGIPVKMGDTITEPEAEHQLLLDVTWAQTCINQNVHVPLKQNQFDALVCFVYNVGADAFQKSTMLKLLNMMLYAEAADQFSRWIYDNGKKVDGLINRRSKEQAMFLGK
jgi:lysozyme